MFVQLVWFLVQRVLWSCVTLWLVFTVTFFLMRMVPGGPFQLDRNMSAEIQRNLAARYGMDLPLWQQYGNHLWRTLQGDLGPSFTMADYSVREILGQGFVVSASLGVCGLAFAVLLGVPAGVLSAAFRAKRIDRVVMLAATLGMGVPNFVLGSVGIVLFVFGLPLFPAAGWGNWRQLVLPSLCLGAPYAAYLARLTRTGMLEVLGQDYIRLARAKGLRSWSVLVRHALRGALLPVVSFLGSATAGVLTGSLVVERIFALPGMGSHFVEAALHRDFTLAMGAVLVYTLLLCVVMNVVDLLYALIDPRVKLA